MLSITHSAKKFLEDSEGVLAIYGTDNAGYWIGKYMRQCGIEFSFYLTDRVVHDELMLNGKKVFSLYKLREFKDITVRVILASQNYIEDINSLIEVDYDNKLELQIFVPVYPPLWKHISGVEYNINRFLGYFRRKLIHDIPTIISNDCTAGRIYESLGAIAISPTINAGISHVDFMKICRDPKHYLSGEIDEIYWQRAIRDGVVPESPVGRIDDIFVNFGHDSEIEGISQRWSQMCRLINWDNMVFMLTDNIGSTIPFGILEEFEDIKGINKIVIYKMGTYEKCITDIHTVYMKDFYFSNVNDPIENHFDVIGWLNGLNSKEENTK